jgi:hypothetical protein
MGATRLKALACPSASSAGSIRESHAHDTPFPIDVQGYAGHQHHRPGFPLTF